MVELDESPKNKEKKVAQNAELLGIASVFSSHTQKENWRRAVFHSTPPPLSLKEKKKESNTKREKGSAPKSCSVWLFQHLARISGRMALPPLARFAMPPPQKGFVHADTFWEEEKRSSGNPSLLTKRPHRTMALGGTLANISSPSWANLQWTQFTCLQKKSLLNSTYKCNRCPWKAKGDVLHLRERTSGLYAKS